MFRYLIAGGLVVCLSLSASARSDPAVPPAAPKPATQPASPETAPASQPAGPGADPFSGLREILPRDKLGSLASVRVRDKREEQDRSRQGTISISVTTLPRGAAVYYGPKNLGTTPLTLTAHRGSTPMDVVIRHSGYMTLRTRIMRRVSHSYFFKLSPAKLR